MKLSSPLRRTSRLLHSLFLKCRTYLPRQQCSAFTSIPNPKQAGIGPIYVINLDRQPDRMSAMFRELNCIVDSTGKPLSERVVRHSACDAQGSPNELTESLDVEPFYTLGDQLFVEPQPLAVPDTFDLERPIKMSDAEIAIAQSHIAVWKKIAQSGAAYTLILEDDVWFERSFAKLASQAWQEMQNGSLNGPAFDILYLSYEEVRHGAPKEQVSENVFRPERGLWFMSGYVLSKRGAQKLLKLLPCRGPVDLWINQKFKEMHVRALRRSVIRQRNDLNSTNTYSILPVLCRIGVLDGSYSSLFHHRPIHTPVFVFGPPDSGLTALAMALSMLGYRCCSDLEQLPKKEMEYLLSGHSNCIFNAYVNIESLKPHIHELARRYPDAKFIEIYNGLHSEKDESHDILFEVKRSNVLSLNENRPRAWRAICEHLKMAPPNAPYPIVQDIGQRELQCIPAETQRTHRAKPLRFDLSPWVVEPQANWAGILAAPHHIESSVSSRVKFVDELNGIQSTRWLARRDTFPGNLGLFRSDNINAQPDGGLSFTVLEEQLGVRDFSAAALSSRDDFLFGRFEVTMQATNVPGVVTGFFLHRDSPRQEIDIEIAGNHPDQLLVNVFYNPGCPGAKFDYGYRGTPMRIPLDFDASAGLHRFAIEWNPCEIKWFVDDKLVHQRVIWNPTPIPHLPMTLHINTWPTRSRELAGRLDQEALPTSTIVKRFAIDAFRANTQFD